MGGVWNVEGKTRIENCDWNNRREEARAARVRKRENNIKMEWTMCLNTALKMWIPRYSFPRPFPGRFVCSDCDAVSLGTFS